MATDDQLTRGTVNEALSKGQNLSHESLLSAGFSPMVHQDPTTLAVSGNYNGGLYGRRISRLQKGDILFHFSDSRKTTLEEKFSGAWWFDLECFRTISRTARMEGTDFTALARSLLGVLYDWGDMKNLVGGRLTADFWCFKGLTGGYEGGRQKMSRPERTDIVQIYVPGGLQLKYFTQPHDNVLTSGLI